MDGNVALQVWTAGDWHTEIVGQGAVDAIEAMANFALEHWEPPKKKRKKP